MQLLRPEADERPTMTEASRMLADLASPASPRPLASVGRTAPTLPDLHPPDAEPVDEATPDPEPDLPPTPLLPLLSDRPAAYRPTVMPKRPHQASRRLVFIAAGAIVVVLLVVGVVLLLNSGGSPSHQAGGTGGGTTTLSPRPTASVGPTSASTANTPPAVGTAPSSGSIGYSDAGQKVVNYYCSLNDPPGRLAMLTPGAQKAFGDLAGFEQYWSGFSQLSCRNANGVTPNQDGSVNVPIDVTYTTGTGTSTSTSSAHYVLRVVQENGVLLIDQVAK
jgi:hypothetical protein